VKNCISILFWTSNYTRNS